MVCNLKNCSQTPWGIAPGASYHIETAFVNPNMSWLDLQFQSASTYLLKSYPTFRNVFNKKKKKICEQLEAKKTL